MWMGYNSCEPVAASATGKDELEEAEEVERVVVVSIFCFLLCVASPSSVYSRSILKSSAASFERFARCSGGRRGSSVHEARRV
jgi:hypothetical protein